MEFRLPDGQILSGTEFERLGGRGAAKKWKVRSPRPSLSLPPHESSGRTRSPPLAPSSAAPPLIRAPWCSCPNLRTLRLGRADQHPGTGRRRLAGRHGAGVAGAARPRSAALPQGQQRHAPARGGRRRQGLGARRGARRRRPQARVTVQARPQRAGAAAGRRRRRRRRRRRGRGRRRGWRGRREGRRKGRARRHAAAQGGVPMRDLQAEPRRGGERGAHGHGAGEGLARGLGAAV